MKVVPSVAGPEAELARLSRPSGPWLHLLEAAPADARQLGWLLGQDGVVVRQLRGACGRSPYGLLDEIGAALQLPGDPVEDWPGLAALLTDMAWLPGAGHVLVVTRASLLLAAAPVAELHGLVEAVREVARARAEEGDPLPFHLVLQDDAVGLAALRARLDAVRARYAVLAGWEASEPAADTGPSGRSVLTGGPPDAVDRAAAEAAAGLDGVRSVGRVWEEFRGGSAGPVRTYVPLLAGPADVAAVATALAGAVAAAGASCVVVPAPADVALADARQAAVAAAATEIWPDPPTPEAPAEPADPGDPAGLGDPTEPADSGDPTEPAAPGDPADGSGPAGLGDPAEPAAPGDPADASGPGDLGDPAGPGRPAERAERAAAAGPQVAPVGPTPAAGAAPAEPTAPAEPVVPAMPEAAEVGGPTRSAAESTYALAKAMPSAGGPSQAGPRDRPGAGFELIAANLQWPFDTGSEDDDAVDTALVAHAAASGRTAALFRTWVQDPDGSWVRVVLGYVDRSSIADVEAERTALVDALQRSGAARCCVEVLAATDVSEAHRWLEQRCRPLWPRHPAATPTAEPPTTTPHPSPTPGPAPTGPARADAPPARPERTEAARANPARPEAAGSGAAGSGAAGSGAAGSGAAGSGIAGSGTAGSRTAARGPELPADATFRPGPTADDPAHSPTLALLVDWATSTPGVVGLVTAYTGDRLVVGVALDATTDPDRIRATAPAAVEPFAPARGLAPVHLRLSRASTRIWTRRAERAAAPEPARSTGELQRPEAPRVTSLGPPPVRDTDDARADERLGDFVLVGIDRGTEIAKGPPEPDERDAALVAWATAEPTVTALLRARATVGEETIPVYTVAVTEGSDPAAARRALAAATAATGASRAGAEAFDPAGALSAFHLDLAVGSTRLWPRRT